jgi:NAD(P)-dependent dehydrogenase (short-subunit alcohol dehydrogenase family)
MVTGASGGIGSASASLLSRLGASVILVGRDAGKLDKVLSTLEGREHTLEIFPKDVDAVPEWMNVLAGRHGLLDALVHAAGVQETRPLRLVNQAHMEKAMQVNLYSAAALSRGFRQKGVSNGGSIVFISSVMGMVGQPGQSSYSASKGALIALSRSLALELARDGIRVNCIAPGIVRTKMSDELLSSLPSGAAAVVEKMHPLGFGLPEDVANAVAFLVAATGRWITGTTLVVDGGYTAH